VLFRSIPIRFGVFVASATPGPPLIEDHGPESLWAMSDVSSCIIDPSITPGYHVAEGEELGYFQFGGSTYCLIFRPAVIADFALAAIPQPHDPDAPLMLINSKLAAANTV
jgi:hypothetical protein